MALPLHNVNMIKMGKMPFHGAMVRLRFRRCWEFTLLLIGDTATGKSEILEAFRNLGEQYLREIAIIADDMGIVRF